MDAGEKHVIFALDVTDQRKALEYAKALPQIKHLKERIFAVKAGILSILEGGLSLIEKIKHISEMEVICDLKLADVPHISAEVAKQIEKHGGDYIVIQGFVGEKVIDNVIEAVPNMKIILVSEMSHNVGGFTHDLLEKLADLARDKQVFGIIGPGNRPERLEIIRRIVGDKVKIIAAGVSKQQGGEEYKALAAGANFVIEGRSVIAEIERNRPRRKRYKIVLATFIYLAFGFSGVVYLKNIEAPPWHIATFLSSATIAWIGLVLSKWLKT
jgi:orotidine-5'-phosphate decarboxylase